ncbi:MAG: hypothetical protein QM451_08195 [Bacillota bacterium]|jgi:hypothetical protein|nr:hypothetical protein [Bacillota bacterium]HHT89895.1 hypothetical protein [Bacillota bacterium]
MTVTVTVTIPTVQFLIYPQVPAFLVVKSTMFAGSYAQKGGKAKTLQDKGTGLYPQTQQFIHKKNNPLSISVFSALRAIFPQSYAQSASGGFTSRRLNCVNNY